MKKVLLVYGIIWVSGFVSFIIPDPEIWVKVLKAKRQMNCGKQ